MGVNVKSILIARVVNSHDLWDNLRIRQPWWLLMVIGLGGQWF